MFRTLLLYFFLSLVFSFVIYNSINRDKLLVAYSDASIPHALSVVLSDIQKDRCTFVRIRRLRLINRTCVQLVKYYMPLIAVISCDWQKIVCRAFFADYHLRIEFMKEE